MYIFFEGVVPLVISQLPMFVLAFIFLFIFQWLNIRFLNRRAGRFLVSLASSLIILLNYLRLWWVFSTDDVMAMLNTEDLSGYTGAQLESSVSILHSSLQEDFIFLGVLFSLSYLIIVYFSWFVLSFVKGKVRSNK